jgi:transposase-like protein
MAKYSYEFKLQVVQAYLDGEGGFYSIFQRLNYNPALHTARRFPAYH